MRSRVEVVDLAGASNNGGEERQDLGLWLQS